jgi:hypothetical protein
MCWDCNRNVNPCYGRVQLGREYMNLKDQLESNNNKSVVHPVVLLDKTTRNGTRPLEIIDCDLKESDKNYNWLEVTLPFGQVLALDRTNMEDWQSILCIMLARRGMWPDMDDDHWFPTRENLGCGIIKYLNSTCDNLFSLPRLWYESRYGNNTEPFKTIEEEYMFEWGSLMVALHREPGKMNSYLGSILASKLLAQSINGQLEMESTPDHDPKKHAIINQKGLTSIYFGNETVEIRDYEVWFNPEDNMHVLVAFIMFYRRGIWYNITDNDRHWSYDPSRTSRSIVNDSIDGIKDWRNSGLC